MTQKLPQALPTASIDLDAIAHNVAVLREHAGPAAVMAVVKADGYGHGAHEVGRAAAEGGATGLAVVVMVIFIRRARRST